MKMMQWRGDAVLSYLARTPTKQWTRWVQLSIDRRGASSHGPLDSLEWRCLTKRQSKHCENYQRKWPIEFCNTSNQVAARCAIHQHSSAPMRITKVRKIPSSAAWKLSWNHIADCGSALRNTSAYAMKITHKKNKSSLMDMSLSADAAKVQQDLCLIAVIYHMQIVSCGRCGKLKRT